MVLRLLGSKRKRALPRLPPGLRIYAIGDVHGRAELLEEMFLLIDAHQAGHPAVRPVDVLVGDYIDRGPASREVLDLLIRRARSHETVCLKGNHETFIFEFLHNPAFLENWSQMGGRETLMSYGIMPPNNPDAAVQLDLAKALRSALPRSHVTFLGGLPPSFSCGGFFFAHAGVKPGVPLAKQREDDLLWIREEFLFYEKSFGKMIVHGHTPVLKVDIHPNRINIDTGAYATGRLSCLVIEGDRYEPL